MKRPIIVWFRQDLRLADHPALSAALTQGPVIPVYIASSSDNTLWTEGAASRWWLHYSLLALQDQLKKAGSRLIIRRGQALPALRELIETTQASGVYWTRRYEPDAMKTDAQVQESLKKEGVQAESFNGHLLFEPWTLKTKAGNPFQVFTPFWKTCLQMPPPQPPLPNPARIPRSRPLASVGSIREAGAFADDPLGGRPT